MNAVISGTTGTALVIDGESLMSFDVDDSSKLVVRKQSDLPYLFGEGRDLRVIENSDIESIARELQAESDLALALDLTLISLDEELEEDIRKDGLRDLNELLSDYQLGERLEGILYARPLPDDGDLEGALKLCDRSILSVSFTLLERLERRQSLIEKVSGAWDVIPTTVFGGYEQRSHFQRVAVQRGLFHGFVIALENVSGIPQFLLNTGLDSGIQQLRNSRQVLQAWSVPFRKLGEAMALKPDAEESSEAKGTPRRRHGRRVGLNRPAVLKEVNRRKGIISAAMYRNDLFLVNELVDDLVDYQRDNGEIEYAAKSLCDLAIEAKELGLIELRLALTKRSISIAPDDYWSWAQYGDALLSLQRLDEALAAFQQSEDFGAGVLARTGKGEVLKARGAFKDALDAFDEVIRQHPENVVAKNGRAEVLKAQGEFKDALAAYDQIIRQYPEDVVAKNGRAEVLKAQGELKDSLAAYNEVIRQHPENVFAQNGRAEVLKALGEFKEALAAFDEIIRHHPENVVAKNGRAEVLKAQGEFKDALAAFDEVIRLHPENVVAKTGRAEVLKAQGEFKDALAAYDQVIRQHPEDVVAQSGRAEVLKAQGEFKDALAAYDQVIRLHPENVVAQSGRAEVLKAQGEFKEALTAYDQVIKQHPENMVAKRGRADVLKASNQLDDALAAYDEIMNRFPYDGIARNGRSSTLLALGRYREALAGLPDENPVGLQGWIGLHIRGMVLMSMKRIEDAVRIFQRGVAESPFLLSAAYFQAALAVALIRQEKYGDARNVLCNIDAPNLKPQIDVLRLHVSGEEKEFEEANAAFQDLTPKPWSISNDLLDELHRRYILKAPPKQSNEWVFDQEVECLLLVASQQSQISSYAY